MRTERKMCVGSSAIRTLQLIYTTKSIAYVYVLDRNQAISVRTVNADKTRSGRRYRKCERNYLAESECLTCNFNIVRMLRAKPADWS